MSSENDFKEGLLAQARQWSATRMNLANEQIKIAHQQAALARRFDEIEAQLTQLLQQLRAAAVLVPDVDALIDSTDKDADVALTDAIMTVLSRTGPSAGMQREAIRRQLPAVGYKETKINANPNYLYIALRRLIDRGLVRKLGPDAFSIVSK